MNTNFTDFMEKYKTHRVAIAISGGVDSVCLLHWVVAIGMDVVALHVNHGLRAAAITEEKYVRDLCDQLNVPLNVFHWMGAKPESGLESAARDARYAMMTDYCQDNNIDVLMTAHQADDQIETFLMNLGRGSGVFGLGAMRDVTMRDGIAIVRPLLGVFRRELEQYCDDNSIKYFHDEMNDDDKYTRVRIRKNRHILSDDLGISDERILLAINNLGRTRDALDAYIQDKVAGVLENDRAVFMDSFLFDEPLDFRLRLLGALIQKVGGDTYAPRLNSLENALGMLYCDCKFTLGHCSLRRLGSKIVIVKEGKSVSLRIKNAKSKK